MISRVIRYRCFCSTICFIWYLLNR